MKTHNLALCLVYVCGDETILQMECGTEVLVKSVFSVLLLPLKPYMEIHQHSYSEIYYSQSKHTHKIPTAAEIVDYASSRGFRACAEEAKNDYMLFLSCVV